MTLECDRIQKTQDFAFIREGATPRKYAGASPFILPQRSLLTDDLQEQLARMDDALLEQHLAGTGFRVPWQEAEARMHCDIRDVLKGVSL